MKSPFPGMDPFIETPKLWGDFHQELITEIKRDIAQRLPERYTVRTDVRSYVELVEQEGKEAKHFEPDVSLLGPSSAATKQAVSPPLALAETSTEEEVTLRAFIAEQFRENFIEIYYKEEDEILITCIEVLSPSNKRKNSVGWREYVHKRQGLLLGEASLVELDLLRGGTRLPMLDPWPECPYTLLVARQRSAPRCRVLKAHSLRPLPSFPVPLLPDDPDIMIDLQPKVDAMYERNRYSRNIDYTRPPPLPLSPEETAWLQEHLRQSSP
jgi:hypothetical protein